MFFLSQISTWREDRTVPSRPSCQERNEIQREYHLVPLKHIKNWLLQGYGSHLKAIYGFDFIWEQALGYIFNFPGTTPGKP